MERQSLASILQQNTYPGRGIVMGLDETGRYGVIAYFIMGRSANSRNRIFVEEEDGSVYTRAFDESKLEDPSLIIYAPVRVLDLAGTEAFVVTNGDQTDTVRDYLESGKTFEEALRTRTFEPDAPNYTPRISGLMQIGENGLQYRLSILKSDAGDPESVQRFFYEYAQPKAGEGHFIHTYRCDGNPIPSFEGEPETVTLRGDVTELAWEIYQSLNEENKVSLYCCYVDLETGDFETCILNKNEEE